MGREEKPQGEEQEARGFKVVDRRRFDEHGLERPTATDAGPSPTQSRQSAAESDSSRAHAQPSAHQNRPASNQTSGPGAETSATTQTTQQSSSSTPKEEPAFDFSVFIMSLADQAMWQLGLSAPPDGIHIPPDPLAAKQTIDILTMLEIKTRGNREAMEERLIKAVLHELRMAYLKVAR